ncbi:hypothetical protein M501DRAFT_999192 [Patellaria atrata CBS 101060]|uniref:YMC020W-like alpha/beta hydrolase domain-containing protein n=1 Tax=Patellaria atrata CBS 101060 TaxID=1346257 RepID=A0A9P4S4I9_9PEZI|nr:hypothetical protein M501DRAFT_999192 [Patellaria atrata CBS 101060]
MPQKKSKPNPKAPAITSISTPEVDNTTAYLEPPKAPDTSQSSLAETSQASLPQSSKSTHSKDDGFETQTPESQDNKLRRKSWYNSGNWKSKPVAQVAKESISSAGGVTSELVAESKQVAKNALPARLLSGSMRRPSKGNTLAASTTKLNVTSNGVSSSATSVQGEQSASTSNLTEPSPPLPPDPTQAQTAQGNSVVDGKKEEGGQVQSDDLKKPATTTSSWRGWWSKPDVDETDTGRAKQVDKEAEAASEDAQKTPLPGISPFETPADKPILDVVDDKPPQESAGPLNGSTQSKEDTAPDKDTQSRSWFWLWSTAQNAKNTSEEPAPESAPLEQVVTSNEVSKPQVGKKDEPPHVLLTGDDKGGIDKKKDPEDKKDPAFKSSLPKSSGWAFWSKDKPKTDGGSDTDSTHKQIGELAVSDTPSQSHPEAAQFNEHDNSKDKDASKESSKPRGRQTKTKTTTTKPPTPAKASPSHSPTRKAADLLEATKQIPKGPANLLLPRFEGTYSLAQSSSYWQQLRNYFLGADVEQPQVHISSHPPKIKKALAIGIHGFFPSPIFQKVLGQPTGTSIRFANAAATSIKNWTDAHGYSCEIEKVALEGEGTIADRVEILWKLLLNWFEDIKTSDFILVACHSQGVPVAIMLVAKLIQFGCVNAARIGICAMAGVNLGPFAEYKSRFFGGSASELFEFCNPKSAVSTMYADALDVVLRHGVRIVYIGSIDDQLVSLESSTFSTISHPYIYRAVFVDGRIHAPDFITHLVGFALKLRNLGIPDHGLVRELSPAMAGSLYSGEGHSRIYDDPAVYDLAVRHALETTDLPALSTLTTRLANATSSIRPTTSSSTNSPVNLKAISNPYLQIQNYEGPASSANSNPYILPWAMRGLLEEEFVKKDAANEVKDLVKLFEDWKPNTKVLRDVKFRLEAVRSKL